MTYRSILTLVDGSRRAEHCGRVAAGLAERFGARLTGAFPRPAPPVSAWDQPLDWGLTPSIPPPLSAEVLAAHERRSDARGEGARMAFEAAADEAGCRSDWLVISGESAAGALRLMRRTDLAVLPSGRLPTVGPVGASAADLVLDSGGPALLLPDRPGATLPGRRILVAWNGSREAPGRCETPGRFSRSPSRFASFWSDPPRPRSPTPFCNGTSRTTAAPSNSWSCGSLTPERRTRCAPRRRRWART